MPSDSPTLSRRGVFFEFCSMVLVEDFGPFFSEGSFETTSSFPSIRIFILFTATAEKFYQLKREAQI